MTLKEQIIEALQEHGPMTSTEIAKAVGISVVNARARICELRREKRLFISQWVRVHERGRTYPRALWKVGKQADAPKIPPLTGTETSRRYRERQKTAGLTSVFALGIKASKRRVPKISPPMLKAA